MLTLIDTSVWIAVLRKNPDRALAEEVRMLIQVNQAAWCGIIRLELWVGVRDAQERKQLRMLESVVRDITISDEIWSRATEIADLSRANGVTAPPSDILIYTCAQVASAKLLHRDKHFDALANIN